MAYTPKVWECGDIVTAEALNHIEQGIAENAGGGVQQDMSVPKVELC